MSRFFIGNQARGIRAAHYETDYLVSHLDFSVSNTDLKDSNINWNLQNIIITDGAAIFNNNSYIQTTNFPSSLVSNEFTWAALYELEPNTTRNTALFDARPAGTTSNRPGIAFYQTGSDSLFYHSGSRTPNITGVFTGTAPRLTSITIARKGQSTIVRIDSASQEYIYNPGFGNFHTTVTLGQNIDSIGTSAWGLKGKIFNSKIFSKSLLH